MTCKDSRSKKSHLSGFTLVELLVVITIIGTLMSVLLPAVTSAMSAVDRSTCLNNLRQLGIAVQNYAGENQDRLPVGLTLSSTPEKGRPAFIDMLLYLDQKTLHERYTIALPPSHEDNEFVVSASVGVYRCPSDGSAGRVATVGNTTMSRSNYALNFGSGRFGNGDSYSTDGPFRAGAARKFADLEDGYTSTILISEVIAGTIDNSRQRTDYDARGLWAHYMGGSSSYTHYLLPNSTKGRSNDPEETGIGGDAMMGGEQHCFDERGLPCNDGNVNDFRDAYAGARSEHAGGVQAVFGDAHAHFIRDDIDIAVWRAFSTINKAGSEPHVDPNDL